MIDKDTDMEALAQKLQHFEFETDDIRITMPKIIRTLAEVEAKATSWVATDSTVVRDLVAKSYGEAILEIIHGPDWQEPSDEALANQLRKIKVHHLYPSDNTPNEQMLETIRLAADRLESRCGWED